jgi:hypothetical protein
VRIDARAWPVEGFVDYVAARSGVYSTSR